MISIYTGIEVMLVSIKELRIGVIGVASRGGLAALAHKPEEGSRLVAGADINEKALADFRERYGADTFITKDYKELLARPDIDAVFVTSPDFLHEAQAVAALEAGKHVYLEKPMAITIAGCDRILAASMQSGARLYLGHNMRHMEFVRKMKELIDTGAIGEPKTAWCRHFICYGCDAYYKDWHAERANTTSLLLQKGAHDIDVLHWLCGGYTTRVSAMGALMVYDKITDRMPPGQKGDVSWSDDNWPPLSQKGLNAVVDVEDVNMMLMQLDNGVFASYQQCHFAPDGWRNYTVIGTEGRIENLGDVPGECVVRLWNKRKLYNPEGDENFVISGEGAEEHGGADPRIVAEFLRFVREGGKTDTSPIAARQAVAAGCLAAESLRNGNVPLEVPQLPAEVLRYFGEGK
jgi:predicted dehydrogenase